MANLALTARSLPVRGVVLTAPRPAPVGVFLGVVGLVFAALLMGGLNIVAADQMNPLDTTMSDYVFVEGAGWMFPAALLAMCVAGAGVGIGLAARGLLRGVLPKLSLGLAIVGLLLAAAFETDMGDESVTLSAQIHRYAAGVVFFCVPITAALVARKMADRRALYVGATVATVLLALFLTCHLGPMPDALGELSGLLQRLLFVAELVVLGQLVRIASRAPAGYALAA
jgi:heme A synthase